jgi:DNA-binding protein Fis
MLDKRMSLNELENLYIQVVFNDFGENTTKAAQSLGITRKTLQSRLNKNSANM